MKYAYIDRYRREFAVKSLCRALDISRSRYYAYKAAPQSLHSLEDMALRQEIVRVHTEHRWIPGSVKTWRLLNGQGVRCGKHRIARLRKLDGVKSNRSRRAHSKQAKDRSQPPAPNLVQRRFQVGLPNQVWVGDMTMIRTKEGFLHLAVVLDLFARRVVGWSMHDAPVVALPTAALQMAIDQRKPAPGLIFHSDQGSAYGSHDYRELMGRHGLQASMSRKGNCHDNAVAESFFSSLKNELIHDRIFPTRAEAAAVVNDYIAVYYNQMRLHQTLRYQTPVKVEAQFCVPI
ncbi:IS3 family transposase [Duganella sp. Dugasp56]|uniref:IS3 family transposase n=1 Tax=unclassified Duganella TaxID=2636909 RepID=UPI0039AF1791